MEGMFASSSFNAPIGDWDVSKVENMRGAFNQAVFFDQDLGSWNIGNVTNMQNMLDGSGMSTTNYSNTLSGWGEQQEIPNGITLGAEGLEYCGGEAEFNRALLVEAHNWDIVGGAPCP